MMSNLLNHLNEFNNDKPLQLIAATNKKAAVVPEPTAEPAKAKPVAKLLTKPPPPGQACKIRFLSIYM
jgi:hypothetical protein